MTYEGHVEKGVIVLDGAVALAEGTRVRIELAPASNVKDVPTLTEQLGELIGSLEGLPEDWSEKHDKYLREEVENMKCRDE